MSTAATEVSTENASSEETMFRWTTALAIGCTALTLVAGEMLKRRNIFRIPEAAVGILVGFTASAIAKLSHATTMVADERFDDQFFMVWLLPPIIFAAGYNMNVGAFFENFGPTMLLAFVGTLLSALVVAGLVYGAGAAGMCHALSPLAALFFGSLISATDPVTVLAIFKAIGVRSDLFSIIFGESVLNDAVAIVLARTTLAFAKPGADVSFGAVLHAFVVFITIFVGSSVIGVLAGACSSLLVKSLNLSSSGDKLVLEAALAAAFPWMAYYMSEALEFSGIVAILFCGIVMSVYAKRSMSDEARHFTSEFFETIATVAECFIFIYLGMAFFTFPILTDRTAWPLCIVALAACFLGRTHVFLLSWVYNKFQAAAARRAARRSARSAGRGTPTTPPPIGSAGSATVGSDLAGSDAAEAAPTISKAFQFIIWFSGLRGGVAFALAAASYHDHDFADACEANHTCAEGHRSDALAIIQATLMIAVFTIFVFGSAVKDVAVYFSVLEPPSAGGGDGHAGGGGGQERANGVELNGVARGDTRSIRARWARVNERYVVPRLSRSQRSGERRSGEHSSRAMLSTREAAWNSAVVEGLPAAENRAPLALHAAAEATPPQPAVFASGGERIDVELA